MRYKEGKRAVILDHVGNVLRFGMPDDNREWTLDAVKKQAPEFQVIACEKCFYTFPKRDAKGKIYKRCPKCGEPLKHPKETPEKKDREPIEESGEKLGKVTEIHAIPAMPSTCRTVKDLSLYAKSRGYKQGWVYYTAKRMGLINNDKGTQAAK